MYLEMKKICINCYTPSAYKEGRVYTLNIGHLSVLREYEVLVRVQYHDKQDESFRFGTSWKQV